MLLVHNFVYIRRTEYCRLSGVAVVQHVCQYYHNCVNECVPLRVLYISTFTSSVYNLRAVVRFSLLFTCRRQIHDRSSFICVCIQIHLQRTRLFMNSINVCLCFHIVYRDYTHTHTRYISIRCTYYRHLHIFITFIINK